MGSKLAIVSGLVAGIVAGGALVGAVVVYAPIPTRAPAPAATPAPSVAAAASPSAPSAGPGASPGASGAPSAPSSAPPSSSPSPAAFGIGRPAPALSVPKVGGGTVDLASLRGKPVWVNFMATWSPPCRDQLPVMAGFEARYAPTGLVILVIDVREDPDAIAAFMASLNVSLPVGLDETGRTAAAWRTPSLPVHFWIDRDGIVRAGALGGIGPDEMATNLGTILPGVTVTP